MTLPMLACGNVNSGVPGGCDNRALSQVYCGYDRLSTVCILCSAVGKILTRADESGKIENRTGNVVLA